MAEIKDQDLEKGAVEQDEAVNAQTDHGRKHRQPKRRQQRRPGQFHGPDVDLRVHPIKQAAPRLRDVIRGIADPVD